MSYVFHILTIRIKILNKLIYSFIFIIYKHLKGCQEKNTKEDNKFNLISTKSKNIIQFILSRLNGMFLIMKIIFIAYAVKET